MKIEINKKEVWVNYPEEEENVLTIEYTTKDGQFIIREIKWTNESDAISSGEVAKRAVESYQVNNGEMTLIRPKGSSKTGGFLEFEQEYKEARYTAYDPKADCYVYSCPEKKGLVIARFYTDEMKQKAHNVMMSKMTQHRQTD